MSESETATACEACPSAAGTDDATCMQSMHAAESHAATNRSLEARSDATVSRSATEAHLCLLPVSRRARGLVDDGQALAHELVEHAALAYVGPAHQRNIQVLLLRSGGVTAPL